MTHNVLFSRSDRWRGRDGPVLSCVVFHGRRRIGTIEGRERLGRMLYTPRLGDLEFPSYELLMDAKEAVRAALRHNERRAPLAA